jgi:hypothetical protein
MRETKVDPGVGYRLLGNGETILASDQYRDYMGHWVPAFEHSIGKPFDSRCFNPYRRKVETPVEAPAVDPGVGYRLLEVGETLQDGDQYQLCGQWVSTGDPGRVLQVSKQVYRRKLPRKKIYIAGPMRGIRLYNFPAFDDAAERLFNQGWDPVNPADIDRDCGFDPESLPANHDWGTLPETLNLRDIIRRDVDAIFGCDAVYVLPGYERSRGSKAEIALAEWLNLEVIYEAKEPEAPVAPLEANIKTVGEILREANAELHQAAQVTLEPELAGHQKAIFDWHEGIEALKAAEAQAEDILETALRITKGDRQAQYGPPDQDFRRTAAMWNGLFAHMLQPGASFEPRHIAMAMVLLKLSRLMHQPKRDSWIDVAGYARCGSICDEVA